MTQQPPGFGRRRTPGPGGSPSALPAASSTQPSIGELLRHPRMLVMIPFTIGVSTLIVLGLINGATVTAKPRVWSASAASDNSSCRAKAAAGSAFDIDWCQAAGAAVRGAATGLAMGAARR